PDEQEGGHAAQQAADEIRRCASRHRRVRQVEDAVPATLRGQRALSHTGRNYEGNQRHEGHNEIAIFVLFVVDLCVFFVVHASAQIPLATYEGADRLTRIAAAAKQEGALTLYTTIAEKDLRTLITPFENKYGVKVTVWRSGTDSVLRRTVA